MMGLGIVYPIGAVLQGVVADRTGVRAVTVAGAVILWGGLALLASLRPQVFTALGDPPEAAEEVGVLPTAELP